MPGHGAEASPTGGDDWLRRKELHSSGPQRHRCPGGAGTRQRPFPLSRSRACAAPAAAAACSLRARWGGSHACQAPRPLRGRGVFSLGCQFAAGMEILSQLSLLTTPLGALMPCPSSSCYSEGTGRTGQRSFCRDIQVLQKKSYCSRTSALSPEIICCFH